MTADYSMTDEEWNQHVLTIEENLASRADLYPGVENAIETFLLLGTKDADSRQIWLRNIRVSLDLETGARLKRCEIGCNNEPEGVLSVIVIFMKMFQCSDCCDIMWFRGKEYCYDCSIRLEESRCSISNCDNEAYTECSSPYHGENTNLCKRCIYEESSRSRASCYSCWGEELEEAEFDAKYFPDHEEQMANAIKDDDRNLISNYEIGEDASTCIILNCDGDLDSVENQFECAECGKGHYWCDSCRGYFIGGESSTCPNSEHPHSIWN
jgi:hypothetical protein